jgi:hypothetical protein
MPELSVLWSLAGSWENRMLDIQPIFFFLSFKNKKAELQIVGIRSVWSESGSWPFERKYIKNKMLFVKIQNFQNSK